MQAPAVIPAGTQLSFAAAAVDLKVPRYWVLKSVGLARFELYGMYRSQRRAHQAQSQVARGGIVAAYVCWYQPDTVKFYYIPNGQVVF